MHILFLADAVFEDIPGGSRVVARELARGLVRRGHQVTFLVVRKKADGTDETLSEGVRVVRFTAPQNPVRYIRAAKETCARLLEETAFDIVHTQFAYAAFGPLKVIPGGVPQVRSFYGPWHSEGLVEDKFLLKHDWSHDRTKFFKHLVMSLVKYSLRFRIEQANLKRAAVAIALSDQSKGELIALGYPAEKIRKIPGGVDVERFVPPADKSAVQSALGLPPDRFILFSVRRLAPRMGLDNLIKALPAVVARHPQALLVIGGKGPEAQRLTALITTLGLQENVRLVGFIPEEELVSYFQAAHVFVLPTVALEGFGLVTAEALSCGVPVLGTHIGATPEILTQLDPRLVIQGTSPQAISEAILRFREEDWAKELTPDRLRRFILERYQWDRHVEAVESIYNELAEASRKSKTNAPAHEHEHFLR